MTLTRRMSGQGYILQGRDLKWEPVISNNYTTFCHLTSGKIRQGLTQWGKYPCNSPPETARSVHSDAALVMEVAMFPTDFLPL